jgi:hypothetical protein
MLDGVVVVLGETLLTHPQLPVKAPSVRFATGVVPGAALVPVTVTIAAFGSGTCPIVYEIAAGPLLLSIGCV